jgi:metallo-beta-lactamase family protein
MNIIFYGAAQEVTGSKHLLQIRGKNILLDCGMFQGHRQEAEDKNRHLPFKPSEIDAVVLSHAHLDHCGSLPTMYAQGFRGPIFATPATKDVAELIMLDSAHIQQSDNAHIAQVKNITEPDAPLYSDKEVYAVMKQFVSVPYHQDFSVTPHLIGYFKDAGHILGSAQVELTIKDIFSSKRLGFTGDLGRSKMPILKDPEQMSNLDYLITESTYGNRLHESFAEAKRIIKKYVIDAVARQAKIIVPSFALGRTQELIYILHQLIDTGELPRFPIYVDSPLAINITDVFKAHPECFDKETFQTFSADDNPFGFRNLTYTRTTAESISLNNKKGPLMVISAAGMCEAGRIRHHLKNSLENRNDMILVTGFMAKNTLGRKIVDGDPMIKIFDNMYRLRAQVVVINALSAHADSADLVAYTSLVGDRLKKVFIVHGEEMQSSALQGRLQEKKIVKNVYIPEFKQVFKI